MPRGDMATDQSPLLTERVGSRIVLLRLNRPDRLNAVSLPLYNALQSELDRIAADRSVRVVIITGQGRGFCVGADLKAHGSGELSANERETYVGTAQRVNRSLQRLPQPVVAAVNGHAIGAGLELALSCDLIVVAAEAKLRLPELGLGTFVGGGTVYTLVDRVGLARAKEMIMLGDFFRGEDPVALGFANRIAPASEVVDVAIELAERLAGKAPVSMALAKDLLHAAQRSTYEEALDREAKALLRCMGTRDWREGINAFHEKREPEFVGE